MAPVPVLTPEKELAKRELVLTLAFFVVPLLLLLAMIGGVALLLNGVGMPGHQDPHFYAQYCRVELGMTRAEVESVFGFAGRELTAAELSVANIKDPRPEGFKAYQWHHGSCWATVQFVEGRVIAKDFFEPYL